MIFIQLKQWSRLAKTNEFDDKKVDGKRDFFHLVFKIQFNACHLNCKIDFYLHYIWFCCKNRIPFPSSSVIESNGLLIAQLLSEILI